MYFKKAKHGEIKCNIILKKFICMTLVFIMLTMDFINCIPSFAESKEENNSVETSVDRETEVNSDGENKEDNKTEEVDESAKESSEDDTKKSDENSNVSANLENTKGEENNAKNIDNTKIEENNTKSGSNEKGEENLGNENQTKGQTRNINQIQANTENQAAQNQTIQNLEETQQIPEELDAGIKATTKEKIEELQQNGEYKTSNDNYEIRTFVTQFSSGATKDANNNLVWTATTAAKGHEFTFRVNYALSGYGELAPGAVQITIPKQILRNRNGNLDDYYIMSLLTLKECEEENETPELIYKEDGNYLVIYNPQEVAAGLNGYFEVAYATNSQTFEYKDYDKTSTQSVNEGGTASDPFYAVIKVKTGEDELTNVSDDKAVFIDTNAKIVSTQKRYPNIYREWNSTWMEETPEDSDKYYYLVWEIRTYIEKNPTQYYNFTLQDVVQDLTDGTTGEDYEIVGYKLAGNRYYTTSNTQSNQTKDEYRYDYVLTRHKIDTYKGIEYTLKNTVTAVVDPIDQVDSDTKATSSNKFFWDPGFTPPAGHFNLFKYGNSTWHSKFGYYWDYANYDLDKFQNEEIAELNGLKYFTETIGYAYPWTLKENGSLDKPEDYGYNSVKYTTWDEKLFLEGEETPMTADDYYLQSLTYSITNTGATYDEFENKFKQTAPTYEDNEKIIFYGKINGDWKEIGTYNLKDGTVTPNTQYVQQMTTNQIILNVNNCTGWKFETSNKHYYTYIVVEPIFALKYSNYVAEKIANKDSIKIQNNVSTKITDYKDAILFEKETLGVDYARVTYYDSQIKKVVSSVSNNVVSKDYLITWKINTWEKATSGSGQAEYIRQDSGKFYDLIPIGGEIDVNSIQVETENGFLPENEYTYEVISNYNNSGRTMLIVSIDAQAQYYNVYYKTVHSWDSMKDYGRKVLNPVAYETGNEKITNGSPDDGGNLSVENKELFVNLDEETDDKKFIYAEQTYNINAVTATVSGLYKKVKNSKETDYSYETQVEPNGKYSYQLRYQNTYVNQAKNLVLYDSLENFKIIDSKVGTTTTSGWKGTLLSVDLNQLERKGIAPVLYISTVEDLDLENNHDLTNTAVWKRANTFTELSNVTAIAIDMTKDIFGNEFILETGESVLAVLHMNAPTEVPEGIENNPYTYNNVYIKNTLIDELAGTEDFFIHQDYTKVKYHVIADVLFKKVNEQDESEGIKDITFRLYGTSNYGTEVDEYVTSDRNGNIKFKDIETGEYILQEYEATPDWVEDHTEHRVVIDNNGKVKIDDNLQNILIPVKITNKPRAHTDVTFTKRNLVNNFTIEGAKFKLEGTSNYGNEILMYATSDENGNVIFEDVEYGTYDLEEIEIPDGYAKTNDKYQIMVDENSNYDVQMMDADDEEKQYKTIYNNGKYNVYNEPLHSFRLIKKDSYYTDQVIEGAKFKLNGVSNYGTTYEKEVTSASTGFVDFSGLEAGVYILQEISVPEITDDQEATITYKLDEHKHAVEIEKDGTVTIDGLKQNDNGNFDFYNEREKKQITITKKWIDDGNTERPDPVIYMSTQKPEAEMSVQYFRANANNSNYYGPLYYITNDYTFRDKITGAFKRNITLNEQEVIALGAVRLDIEYENPDAEYKIYGWIDDNGDCYWWSNAEIVAMTNESNLLFANLNNVKHIDFTDIDMSRVTDMSWMFYHDKKIEKIDTSNFNTSSVTNMRGMFLDCGALKEIDVSNFETQNVTAMYGMFLDCEALKEIDVSNFDTTNVTSMSNMFGGCQNIMKLDVSKFNTSNVMNMSGMFEGCSKLTELDVSKFDTTNVTSMGSMFENCRNLTELDVSKFNTSKVTSMENMFKGCSKLTELDVSKFDTTNVTSMDSMFDGCQNITKLDVSGFNTKNVTTMGSLFRNCSKLNSIDVSNFNTASVKGIDYMFYGCENLSEIDVSNFDTSEVIWMTSLFAGCDNLTEIDISSFDTGNTEYMAYMFSGCRNLITIYASEKFVQTKNPYGIEMFRDCNKLIGGNGTTYNSSNIDKTYAKIDKPGEQGYFTKGIQKKAILHTINFDDDGTRNSNGYYFGTDVDRSVTLEGAEALHVELRYGSSNNEWIAVYDGTVVPSNTNFDESISGKLEGYGECTPELYKIASFDIDGDTVQIHFNTNGTGGPYGYYAVVTRIEKKKIVHTPNVNDDGNIMNYLCGKNEIKKIKFNGAEALHVELRYGANYDGWVAVYDKNVIPSDTNFEESISGKLVRQGNSSTPYQTASYDIEGDTVQFYFNNGNSQYGPYGYYAVVTQLKKEEIVHTSNIDDEGNYRSNQYSTNENKKVTLEGAQALHVELRYGIHKGWLAVYDGDVEPDDSNYNQSILGKLDEYVANQRTYVEKSFDVEGDTVQFYFNMGGATSGPYGYYAVVTRIEKQKIVHTPNIDDNGNITSYSVENSNNKKITLQGAKALHVELKYGLSNNSWVAVYKNNIIPSDANFEESISGKLEGCRENNSSQVYLENSYDIEGDTVQFYFNNGNNQYGPYGYYAVVTALDEVPYKYDDNLKQYAHTINFNDDGSRNSNNYTFGTDVNRTVKIEGAESLHVELKCGTATGWIAVYDGSVIPNDNNYDKSISGKIEGYANTSEYYMKKTYNIQGDTVQFYFNTNGATSGPYGYYAVITPNVGTQVVTTGSTMLNTIGIADNNLISNMKLADTGNKKIDDEIIKIEKINIQQAPVLLAPNIINTQEPVRNDTDNNSNGEVITYSTDTYIDESGERVEWIKNGDTWTYTFYVDDPYATWYVWEDPVPEGYTTNYNKFHPGEVKNREITIINSQTEEKSIPLHRETTVGYGSIEISKTLIGVDNDVTRNISKDEDSTEFTLTVKLTAEEGKENLISGTKVFGSYAFKNGIAKINVQAGDTIELTDLPAGISYTVTEANIEGYQVDGYEGFSSASGSILPDTSSKVQVTNYKNISQSSTPVVEKFVNITLAKNVTGNYEVDESYDFEIALSNLKPNTTYSLSDGRTFTSDGAGSANITVLLGNNDTITLQNIPVGSKYKVYEHAGSYISSYLITDANDKGLINNTSNNNTRENTALSTATETADEGENITITFTNQKTVTQNLKLTKVVTDEEDTNSYIFEIEFGNMKSDTSFNSTIGKVTADSNGTASLTAYLAGGDEAEFYNVPVGTTYIVKELASSSVASYTIVDSNGVNNIVKESDANTIARKALSTELETVNQGEEVTITFINETVNQETDSVTTSIGVTKTVVRPDGSVIEDNNEEFTFDITAMDDSYPMPENSSVTVTGNGNVSFGDITFERTGTYTYKVVERKADSENNNEISANDKIGNSNMYEYDTAEYTIVYEVTNPEGLLEVTKTVKKNGFNSDVITFTNTLLKFPVVIVKVNGQNTVLDGATLQILDDEDNVLKEWVVGRDELNPYFVRLAVGMYRLHEVEPPEGYEATEDITFIVNNDGTVTIDGEHIIVNNEIVNIITMKDTKIPTEPEEPTKPENPTEPEEPTKPENPTEPEEPTELVEQKESENKKTENKNSPQTGDNIEKYIVILAISIIGLAIIQVVYKKSKKQK